MTNTISDIGHAYLDLFGQPPVDIGPDFDPNGFMLDAKALADDWNQVGQYLNNAMFEWARQRDKELTNGKTQSE